MNLELHSLVNILHSHNTHLSLYLGKQLHLTFLKKGLINSTVTIGNRLLQMYVKCGTMDDALNLFDEMPHRNGFSWNTLLEGYIKSGDQERALNLFDSMARKDDFTWSLVVSGFVKADKLEVARTLFDEMPRRNWVVWNSMNNGYAKHGRCRDALRIFKDLSLEPLEVSHEKKFVLATIVGACAELVALACGKQIHARIVTDGVEFDNVLASSLVNFYGRCGDLDSTSQVLNLMNEPDDYSLSAMVSGFVNCGRMKDARRVFDTKSNPDVVLWNSLISGCLVSDETIGRALLLFKEMLAYGVHGNSVTLAIVLGAISISGILIHSQQLHTVACKLGLLGNVISATACLMHTLSVEALMMLADCLVSSKSLTRYCLIRRSLCIPVVVELKMQNRFLWQCQVKA